MLDIDVLIRDYTTTTNVNIKTFLAVHLLVHEFFIKNASASRLPILQQVKDFLENICVSNKAGVLPRGYVIDQTQELPKQKFITSSRAADSKMLLASRMSPRTNLALITSRNPDILLWKILGNEAVQAQFTAISEADSSRAIAADLMKFNADIKSYMSTTLYDYLCYMDCTSEQQVEIDRIISTLGAPADQHRIWSHNSIFSNVMLGRSHKLQLYLKDAHKIIYGLLVLLTTDTTPIVTFGLFDFALLLVKQADAAGATQQVPTQVRDLLWYRLALMFWELKDKLVVNYISELIDLGFEQCYLEYFLPVMALFCAKQISEDSRSLASKLNPKIRTTLDYLMDSVIFATPAMCFLSTILEDSLAYSQHCSERLVSRTASPPKSPTLPKELFTLFIYMQDFIASIIKPRTPRVVSLLCTTLGEYRRRDESGLCTLQQRDAEIVRLQASIKHYTESTSVQLTAYQRLFSEHSDLISRHTVVSEEMSHLTSTAQEKTVLAVQLQSTLCTERTHLLSLTRVLDEQARRIEQYLQDLQTEYEDFETALRTSEVKLIKRLDSIQAKISGLHILAHANRLNPQVNFNLFFCEYLILIYKLFNSLLHITLQKLEMTPENKPACRYISLVLGTLLKYPAAMSFLENHLKHLQENPAYSDNLPQLNTLYRYIIIVAENLSNNGTKIDLSESDDKILIFLQAIGKSFALSPITLDSPGSHVKIHDSPPVATRAPRLTVS